MYCTDGNCWRKLWDLLHSIYRVIMIHREWQKKRTGLGLCSHDKIDCASRRTGFTALAIDSLFALGTFVETPEITTLCRLMNCTAEFKPSKPDSPAY